MDNSLRPSAIGIILGLIGVLFGISWAFYISLNHESIHRSLEEQSRASIEEKFILNSPGPSAGHDHSAHETHDHAPVKQSGDHDHEAMGHGHEAADTHNHEQHAPAPAAPAPGIGTGNDVMKEAHPAHMHNSPEMAEAHRRLTRGHLHAMGLGVLTIAVSVVWAFISAPGNVKTLASACLGIGGIFYPIAWILMGFRTTALGMDGAHQSVIPVAGISVFLVVAGLILTLFYTVKALVKG